MPRTGEPEWQLTVVGPESPASAFPTDIGDADLVAACLSGRPGAFDLVVERHQRAVYQLCYRFVGNHEDASDLTQDVFLRAYRGLRNFRGPLVAGHLALPDRRQRVPQPCERQSAAYRTNRRSAARRRRGANAPTMDCCGAERAARVRAAIAQLPRKQRAALILRMYHDMAHHEIAAALGSSVGAVKANVFHALQNLKKLLGDEAI